MILPATGLCRRGHDRSVLGVYRDRSRCVACCRESAARRALVRKTTTPETPAPSVALTDQILALQVERESARADQKAGFDARIANLRAERRTSNRTATRLLVCGGRDYSDREGLHQTLDAVRKHVQAQRRPVSVLIHGAASGADDLADEWARERGIRREGYIADWGLRGRAAGPERNARMLREGRPDLCVAFPGGRGTADMVARCEQAGVPVLRVGGGQ